jgi:hypothetical protein
LHTLIRRDGLPVVRLSDAPKAGLRFRLTDLERWAAQRVERLSSVQDTGAQQQEPR